MNVKFAAKQNKLFSTQLSFFFFKLFFSVFLKAKNNVFLIQLYNTFNQNILCRNK